MSGKKHRESPGVGAVDTLDTQSMLVDIVNILNKLHNFEPSVHLTLCQFSRQRGLIVARDSFKYQPQTRLQVFLQLICPGLIAPMTVRRRYHEG